MARDGEYLRDFIGAAESALEARTAPRTAVVDDDEDFAAPSDDPYAAAGMWGED